MNIRSTSLAVMALLVVGAAQAYEFRLEKNIPYHSAETLAREGDYAKARCLVDLKIPLGVTNFATVVNIHGGGLVKGNKHMASWQGVEDDPIAHVGVNYRLLTNATPEQCVGDAAAAVAWTLDHIAEYGGDPKKVFLTGISGGGYLTAMIGMAPKWLAAHNHKITDLAGIIPLTGQVTKHFNVRKVGFKDDEPTYSPKIDEWAPLYWTKGKDYPPSLFLTGGRHDNEMPCRVEENEFLVISLNKCGVKNARFIETEGSHGGSVRPSQFHMRDFIMSTADADGVARFGAGERVAFLGDSITHGGRYVGYLQLFQSLRHPGCGTRIFNVGISGDSARGGNQRLDWDLYSYKPDRVFIMFGMNDVGRGNYADAEPDAKKAAARKASLDVYAENERKLVETLQAAGKKVVLMTSTPYDQYTTNKTANLAYCNEPGLANAAQVVRDLATARHLGLVDMHAPLTQIMKGNLDVQFCGDRVHPGAEGHLLMAAQVLKAMQTDPIVAQVGINAKTGRVYVRANNEKKPETQNAVISTVSKRPDGLAFTYAPKQMPFPKLPEYVADERYVPLTDLFNNEKFYVLDLPAGEYDLAFDGVKVGTFSSEAFSNGVNVALLNTPNQQRAQEAAKLAASLVSAQGDLRTVAYQDFTIRRGKVNPLDVKAADAYLDKWLADQEARKSPHFAYYKSVIAKYRTLRGRRAELKTTADELFARLDTVRPAVSRVTVSRVQK